MPSPFPSRRQCLCRCLRACHAPVSCRCSSPGGMAPTPPEIPVISGPLPALQLLSHLRLMWTNLCRHYSRHSTAFHRLGANTHFASASLRLNLWGPNLRHSGGDFWSSAMRRMRNISIAVYRLRATTWTFQSDGMLPNCGCRCQVSAMHTVYMDLILLLKLNQFSYANLFTFYTNSDLCLK